MGVIYEPSGEAREYSHLALNHYSGCGHGCTYCYVPGIVKRGPGTLESKRHKFHADLGEKKDVLERLGKELPRYSGTDKRVLLSFACDPYQPIEAARQLTGTILRMLSGCDVPFQILTKAGHLATRDLRLFGPNDAFAVTLTTLNGRDAAEVEPGAAPPMERVQALKEAKSRGIETWVSLEPVLNPAWSLEIISRTHDFVDLYKIGTLNHATSRLEPDEWRQFGQRAINRCHACRVKYFIKDSLARHLGEFQFGNTDSRTVDRSKN